METVFEYENLSYIELTDNLTLYFGSTAFVEWTDSEGEEYTQEIEEFENELNLFGYKLTREEFDKWQQLHHH